MFQIKNLTTYFQKDIHSILSFLDNLHDIVLYQDLDHKIVWANKKALDAFGCTLNELQGKYCYQVKHDADNSCSDCPVLVVNETKKIANGEIKALFGKLYYEKAFPITDNNHMLTGIISMILDITDQKNAKDIIKHQKNHDILTELPNMNLLKSHFNFLTVEEKLNNIAVLILDLDRFGKINGVMGYRTGNLLLKAVVKRLKEEIKDEGVIFRTGGDEFIVLYNTEGKNLTTVINKIYNSFQRSFIVEEYEIYITSSIGISIYPRDDKDITSLLRKADTAMLKVKKNGGNDYNFFEDKMTTPSIKELTLKSDLRKAIKNKEFILNYQPQVDILTNQIIGVEALIRWPHPKLGLVSPGDFIPLAEDTGLIIDIGQWVLKTVCEQIKIWCNNGSSCLKVSANISARQFMKNNFVEVIKSILGETGACAECLELEITEGISIGNIDYTINILNELKSIGVNIALDDFGTGYSSLKYLQRMNIDLLKIDKSFISDLNSSNKAITETIITLSKNMGINIIAEGVENKEQLDFLKSKQCQYAQGYYFYKPLSKEDIDRLLSIKQSR